MLNIVGCSEPSAMETCALHHAMFGSVCSSL